MERLLSRAIDETLIARAVALRHALHLIPELAYEETKTAALIREELTRLGIEFVAEVKGAPTATVAHVGDREKPCVALRADIDALPLTEETGLAYASAHPGRMHACGHDGHGACLLGAAAALKRIEAELPVCVKLIFQPAEEGGAGAKRLCEAGVLDGRLGPRVERIYGLHGRPTLPLGIIATKPGPLMAATARFRAIFHGQGSHAAYPHLGRDPIVAMAQGILNLQQIVSRETDPLDSAVVTVGMVSGGSAANIIPASATLQGTARTLTLAASRSVRAAIERRLRGTAAACDVSLEFSWQEGYPPTVNDAAAAGDVGEVVRHTFGADAFRELTSSVMGGEDFAYYLQEVPGCFVYLGLRPAGVETYPSLHQPRFDFNDDAIARAVRLHVALALWPRRA